MSFLVANDDVVECQAVEESDVHTFNADAGSQLLAQELGYMAAQRLLYSGYTDYYHQQEIQA